MQNLFFSAKIPVTSYPIAIGQTEAIPRFIKNQNFKECFVIVDGNTRQFADCFHFEVEVIEVPCGEEAKSLPVARNIYQKLVENNANRRSTLLVGIGGGAICDLTGFVAMTFMRGISYALYPTTLVAMVDAAIGSKVGVNGPNGTKNLIGGFYSPKFVQIDLNVLKTLPQREYQSAFAEIIKIACIADDDGRLMEYLQQNTKKLLERNPKQLFHVIKKSIEIKIRYTEPDLTEVNLDRLLNLGHALAHGLESCVKFSLLHGECVAIGIAQSCRLGVSRKLCAYPFAEKILSLLADFKLPVHIPSGISGESLKAEIETIRRVRDGDLREVIPISPGHSIIINDVNIDEILSLTRVPI